jgi:hypothetical protein
MKKLEVKIIEILDNRMDCDGQYITGMATSARDIAFIIEEFITWIMINEYFWGGLCERIMTPIIGLPEVDSFDELFDYWLNNIKK